MQSNISRRVFLSTAAGAFAASAVPAPAVDPAIAKIDKWEAETNRVTAQTYSAYRKDANTRGLMPLETIESGFEKVMREAKETKVTSVPAVWSVYNMGYIVKTPKAMFSIDLVHRRAAEFAPLLDFMLVTHNHGDHIDRGLYKAMDEAGKFVISNFLDNYGVWKKYGLMKGGYTSGEREFSLKDVRIRTSLVDHNHYLINFTMAFEIKVGNWIMYHTGDCGISTKLRTTWGRPDLWLLFPMGSLDVADAVKRVRPKRVVFGHLWELGHETGRLQAPLIKRSLKAAAPYCNNVSLAYWGDRII